MFILVSLGKRGCIESIPLVQLVSCLGTFVSVTVCNNCVCSPLIGIHTFFLSKRDCIEAVLFVQLVSCLGTFVSVTVYNNCVCSPLIGIHTFF